MNDDDLFQALGDIADDVRRGSGPLPVDRIVRRRRHRRAAVRAASAGGALATVAALTLAGSAIARWTPEEPPPAAPVIPEPTASADALPGWPVCGEPLTDPGAGTVEVEVTGQVDGLAPGDVGVIALLTGGGAADLPTGDPTPAVLALLGDDDRVVALVPAGSGTSWTPGEDGTVLTLSGPPSACDPGGGSPVAAAGHRTVLAVRTPGGVAVSAPTEVAIGAVETPAAGADGGRPLIDPMANREDLVLTQGYDPDEAGPSDTLADGDYLADVIAIDLAARTVTVDVGQFLTPEEAVARFISEHGGTRAEAEAEITVSAHWVNESARLRTVPLSPQVDVVGSCGWAPWHERITLEELAGPRTTTTCLEHGQWSFPSDLTVPFQNRFWVDVRGGLVVQLVGQFVS